MRDRSILPLLLSLALVAYAFGWVGGVLPSNKLPIYPDKPAALFAVNYDAITPERAQVAASMLVKEFCDQHGIDWRKYDVESDLSAEESHWQEMMAAAKGESKLVLADESGGEVHDIPGNTDAAIALIGGME